MIQPAQRRASSSPRGWGTTMHVLMVVVFGLAALAMFYFGASLFGRSPQSGASIFIWVWLASALLNGAAGVFRAGIPLLNEFGAFIPIFGIPAAIAWYLAYKHGAGT
jgi:hypothetical protein